MSNMMLNHFSITLFEAIFVTKLRRIRRFVSEMVIQETQTDLRARN